jgi:sigma-B regulation protein RsbU (phosphoserine phosphatase)
MPDGRAVERSFDGLSLVIGRSSRADLSIGDRALSREHARLFADAGSWRIEDLGSRNGSFVNGQAVSSAAAVRPGDLLAVGGTTITIIDDGAGAEVAPVDDGLISEKTVMRPAAELLWTTTDEGPISASHTAEELRNFAERLRILNEVHSALGRSIGLNQLLELILDRAFDHLKPEEGAIFLRSTEAEYYCAASRSVRGTNHRCLYSRNLVREVAEKGLAALVLDTQMDARFAQAASILSSGMRSLVAAPLADGSRPLGMIVLGCRSVSSPRPTWSCSSPWRRWRP